MKRALVDAAAAPLNRSAEAAGATASVGVLDHRRLDGELGLDYFLYTPTRVRRGASPLIVVHGISRNAREHAEAFVAAAEADGRFLVAPRFDEESYPDYQRLGRKGRGERSDRALERLLGTLGGVLPAFGEPILLFGFSGGAQFAHRYLMAHPDRVAAAVVTSAGWYTLPDPASRYPYGLRVATQLPGTRLRSDRFLRVPTLVLVGERDTDRDEALRRSRSVDRQQGMNRVERARRWSREMNRRARAEGLAEVVECDVLQGAGHDFDDCVAAGLVERITGFFRSVEPLSIPLDRNPS